MIIKIKGSIQTFKMESKGQLIISGMERDNCISL